ncbi:unnamed protein product [Plasmodium vivax]|uniref:(malaria parasite P. vivax) hypothetical protein n=1 Tax=Plasmodium vivax TaxID=5855 RepID=A0A8S4H8L3_PLAVI|nr:unnamed protein product [Plasmodium vivax]
MNSKPFNNAPKVTREDLEREFDKTECNLKSSSDELTDGAEYTEEELPHRRTNQEMCKWSVFTECSKKKHQTGIFFMGTSKKVNAYIRGPVGESICWEKGSIPIYGKLKTFKRRKTNPREDFLFTVGTSHKDNPPHTCDGSSDGIGRETPFAHHNKGNHNARGNKPNTATLGRTRGRNLNEEATPSCRIDGKSKNNDRHNVEHTNFVKAAGEETPNGSNGKPFRINKNQMNIPRKCIDQGMPPYSSSKANEQGYVLLTTQMSKCARGKLRLRISGKNQLDKMSQVPLEGKPNEGSTHRFGDLLKGILPKGGRKKKVYYRGYIMKKSYKNRVNQERHAVQHNEKQRESKRVAAGYDVASKQKRQKGSPHVRIWADKESARNIHPKCTIDFVRKFASVDKRMKNYLNEQLKYYGSNVRRENLEQVCLFLRRRPPRRVPHGLVISRSHSIDEEGRPSVPARPCQNCKQAINLKRYIMEGVDKKNTATRMTATDVPLAASDLIIKQRSGREKEKKGQTTNLSQKNKLTDELKNLKKLQKEEINFSTIYTHLTNEKKILKKILNQQIRNNKKDYLKKLIQVKKCITNFVTHFEQILAKIQAEKNGPYGQTHDEDRYYHISSLLKLVEDVIGILADHFYHKE